MTKKRHFKTPIGIFPVYTAAVVPAGSGHKAVLLYHTKTPSNIDKLDFGTMDFKTHAVHAATENLALEEINEWFTKQFGGPCIFLD